ncbi:hypothetical protein NIE88_17405 [Sporolactobacillus shoreicorticis]|uniref:Bh protein n=1 Tax=Sporolactobacillus shoreicorticis TaxID=1923877 RepID=A0ABW5S4Q1_9BACL|nr:hypothetical protein [Sporolactobacillus shoreicorticis]MCO7127536.1 hypothetical protein [Sporolactobacillus shoreicorticis]
MRKYKTQTQLFCTHCHCETDHRVIYIDKKISEIDCIACHKMTRIDFDIRSYFHRGLRERALTKPSRLAQEYRRSHRAFLNGLSLRMISKPYRIAKDLKRSKHIIDRYKKDHHNPN